MSFNDPHVNRALRIYQQQVMAQRQVAERERLSVIRGVQQAARLPGTLAPARQAQALSGWAGAALPAHYPKLQPAVGRQLNQLGQLSKFLNRVYDTTFAFDRALKPIVQRIADGLRPATNVLAHTRNLLDGLPNFAPLLEELFEAARRLEEAAQAGEATLEAAEYGFADHLWGRLYVAGFAHVDPRVRDAVVTNKLAAATRADDFGAELRDSFDGSAAMGRRWRAVEAAFEAHQRREYLLSIPALLPQVEGALVDAMVLKGLAVKKNGKLYLCGEDGGPKLDKNGKPLREIMLHSAVQNARLEEHPTLEGTSSFLADALIQRRNAVLHGRDPRYDKAKLSVQALLVLALLADAVGEIEAASRATEG